MKIRDTKRAFQKLQQGRPLTRKERILVAKAMRQTVTCIASCVARIPEVLGWFAFALDHWIVATGRALSEWLSMATTSQAQGGDGKCTP